jgi:hypothetical protein
LGEKHYSQTRNDVHSIQTGNGVHSKEDADPKILIKDDADQEKDTDRLQILTIKECLRNSLLSVASKLLSSEQVTLDQRSPEEQHLWNSLDNVDIYEFLTGEKDTIPEFQFDWISPEPTICWPANFKELVIPQPQDKPIRPLPPVQVQPKQPPLVLVLPTPPLVPTSDHVLQNGQPIDYRELHTGIKKKLKSLGRKVQAVVTKLAPGAFSPRQYGGGPSTSASQP